MTPLVVLLGWLGEKYISLAKSFPRISPFSNNNYKTRNVCAMKNVMWKRGLNLMKNNFEKGAY